MHWWHCLDSLYYEQFHLSRQITGEQLIVYNVPQKRAIDLIDGRKYLFVGDSDLLADDFIRNFHIKPSRVLHRIEPAINFENYQQQENLISL